MEKIYDLQRVEDDCKAKPCPYCDSRKIEAVQLLRNYNYCSCFDCRARTSYYATVEEAIDAWNRGDITKQ